MSTQTLIFFTQNKGDKARLPKVIGMSAEATGGQRRTTFNGRTHTTLTISATATDNQTNTGAELSFHYRVSGSMPGWHICFTGSEEGSGILNVKFNAGT